MTKYEQEKAQTAARAQHEHNIFEIRTAIEEAKNLLAVIPRRDFESLREWQTAKRELSRLYAFLKDEEKAYKATFEDEEVANEVFTKLGL